jgi:hypothetical protein
MAEAQGMNADDFKAGIIENVTADSRRSLTPATSRRTSSTPSRAS